MTEGGPRVLIGSASFAWRADLLRALPESMKVVGEVAFPADIDAAPEADALVLDADFLSGLARLAESHFPALVVLAADEEALLLVREVNPPGWALLPPDAGARELGAGVAAAILGLASLPADLAEQFLTPPAGEAVPLPETFGAFEVEALTPRERDVLALLSEGEPNKHIAARLGVSENTVKFHLSALYGKLGVKSRASALREGVRRGLVSI